MNVRDRLYEVAMERGLRRSTLLSYERLLNRLGLLDETYPLEAPDAVYSRLWTIDNPNTRRSAVVALRAVLGLPIRIPKAHPRRYKLPDEDTLRLALMTSPHEARGILMMYAGLRLGEACAITRTDIAGNRLFVNKQVQQLHRTGEPTTVRIAPTKTNEATVIVPPIVQQHVAALTETAKPSAVRESIRRAGQKVGIALNPHQLRHWYATTLLARGAPLALVSRQMRHSDVAVTLRAYAQYAEDDVLRFFD